MWSQTFDLTLMAHVQIFLRLLYSSPSPPNQPCQWTYPIVYPLLIRFYLCSRSFSDAACCAGRCALCATALNDLFSVELVTQRCVQPSEWCIHSKTTHTTIDVAAGLRMVTAQIIANPQKCLCISTGNRRELLCSAASICKCTEYTI